MATVTLSVRSERRTGEVQLEGKIANIDGVRADVFRLPAGFGNCIIVDWLVYVSQIATVMADPETHGPIVYVADRQFEVVESLGDANWVRYLANGLSATAPAFRRESLFREAGEDLTVVFAEVDTNATPTGDLTVSIKAMRLANRGGVRPRRARPGPVFTVDP